MVVIVVCLPVNMLTILQKEDLLLLSRYDFKIQLIYFLLLLFLFKMKTNSNFLSAVPHACL